MLKTLTETTTAGLIGIGAILCLALPFAGNAQESSGRSDTNIDTAASQLFGAQNSPALHPSEPIGFYSKGCLAGAEPLPKDGGNWQVMRLSRNRFWGHPRLNAYIQRLAKDAKELDGWPGLLVGDMSQARGGPMLSGHKSHQTGLDADIWLLPPPEQKLSNEERETLSAVSLALDRFRIDRERWTDTHARLLRRAASYPEVARVFVHPTIKQALCRWAGKNRSWLRKIRAWYGHDDHFHVRLACPENSELCLGQLDPPPGDGCGDELDWWLTEDAYRPKPEKKPAAPLKLSDLPPACRTLLNPQ